MWEVKYARPEKDPDISPERLSRFSVRSDTPVEGFVIYTMSDRSNSVAEVVVAICGVVYLAAWSFSFYPQIFLNYQRKT